MRTATGPSALSARPRDSIRRGGALGLLAAFVVALAFAAVDAGRLIGDLGDRRETARASRLDTPGRSGDVAEAFRQLRSDLRDGERFALVFSADVDRDQAGFYRLVALSSLYPAIAVDDPADADVVMVFGPPSGDIRAAFEETGSIAGVWLGRRSP
jgi:hypothetical protein